MEQEQDKVFLEDKVILRPRILFDGGKWELNTDGDFVDSIDVEIRIEF